MCETFAGRGRARPEHRTPHEHLLALLAEDPAALGVRGDLELIVAAFERETFSGEEPDPVQGAFATDAAARVRTVAEARPG